MDIPIQLNHLGQWDSLGKPAGDIKQEGLPQPSLPSSLTSWNGIKETATMGMLIHQYGYGSEPLSQVVACLSDLCLVFWRYKQAVQRSLEDGECGHQGEHGIGTKGRGQDSIGSLQADRHHL